MSSSFMSSTVLNVVNATIHIDPGSEMLFLHHDHINQESLVAEYMYSCFNQKGMRLFDVANSDNFLIWDHVILSSHDYRRDMISAIVSVMPTMCFLMQSKYSKLEIFNSTPISFLKTLIQSNSERHTKELNYQEMHM